MSTHKILFPPLWLAAMFLCGGHPVIWTFAALSLALALGVSVDIVSAYARETPSACNGCRHHHDCAFAHEPRACNGWVAPLWMRRQKNRDFRKRG